MRCKPGDMAVIVRPTESRNCGVIVEVLRAAHPGDLLAAQQVKYAPKLPGPHWWCRSLGRPLVIGTDRGAFHVMESPITESRLLPIRDSDGPDESLAWAPSPAHQLADA